MREINEIIIHCAATRPEWWADRSVEEKRDEIRRWHVDGNGWDDIGYHAVIDRDGSIADGRDFAVMGAHTRGRNQNSLGVCLVGGHGSNENDAFSDHFTPEQDRALRNWIARRKAEHPNLKISGHNEYAAKACPGFNVARWLAHKPAARTSKVQSKTLQGTVAAGVGTAATGATAIGSLDGTAQIIAVSGLVVTGLALVIIFRERLRKWARGDR